MQPRSIEERVTMLERQMQKMRDLPGRVNNLESQINVFARLKVIGEGNDSDR